MNALERRLEVLNAGLYKSLNDTKNSSSKLLQTYSKNFPTYTDHSIEHSQEVMNLASQLLNDEEILLLNEDEVYILCMACILHDIGMCIPEDKINLIGGNEEITDYKNNNQDLSIEIFIRDIHHVLSKNFIVEEWSNLNIVNEKYAYAIALVAQGHRKVDLNDFDIYLPQYFVKNGREFVCLPYLACIIRIADELDVTNLRTPELLCKYYMPNNVASQREWNKHKSTIQVNFSHNTVQIEAKCTDHNILAALEDQFNKIQTVINSCQKTIRAISSTGKRVFALEISKLEPIYKFINFDPKGIKYTFDVKNVINAFVGKDLYSDNNAAIREALQNAVDACNYKKSILKDEYLPKIHVFVTEKEISVADNGLGMDEFIIENYFGKLASSFYNQEVVKNDFQAIGQFGIGVFSYFLISDYIDVETKRKDKKSLRFRTDQDPSGYFHFFDNFVKADDGTKLTLHLKNEFERLYEIDYLESFIKKTFPYVNVPIVLQDTNTKIEINSDDFSLDFERDITPKMYFGSHEYKSKINLFSIKVDNQDLEGSIGMVVPATADFKELILDSHFDQQNFYNKNYTRYTELRISQKGVYVNNYGCRFNFEVGKINLKQKLNINLDRTSFRNSEDVAIVLESLEALLLNKVFDEYLPIIGIKNKKGKAKFTTWFLQNIWNWGDESTEGEKLTAVCNNFHFELHDKGVTQYLSLFDIYEKYDEVYFIPETNKHDSIDVDSIVYILTSPKKNISLFCLFEDFVKYSNCHEEIGGKYFTVMRKVLQAEYEIFHEGFDSIGIYPKFSSINSNKLAIHIWKNHDISKKDMQFSSKYFGVKTNINHIFIKTVFENLQEIRKNSSQRKLIEELLDLVTDFVSENTEKMDLKILTQTKLNNLINRLNSLGDLKFLHLSLGEF